MTSKLHLAVTIDTECDKGAKWKVKQPLQFENMYNGLVNKLQPLFDTYQIRPTYLLSPEVISDTKSVQILKSFGDRVELGTHLHAEFIEPEADFDTDNTKAFQCNYKPEIECEKLRNLTQLFTTTFGYQPRSFRAGRFGIGEHSLSFLENLGYWVDSSVTPDNSHSHSKAKTHVNYFGAPYQPYFPSKTDYRKKGDMNVLQVPVTIYNKKLLNVPLGLKRKIKLQKSYQHILFNYTTNFSKPIWLRPTYANFGTMKAITEALIKKAQGKDVFLCMMFHSNEFELGASPYSLEASAIETMLSRLDSYFKWFTSLESSYSVGLSEIKNIVQDD